MQSHSLIIVTRPGSIANQLLSVASRQHLEKAQICGVSGRWISTAKNFASAESEG
jgi:hypothetical protein